MLAGFLENPDWQFFCGEEYVQHQFPYDPISLVKCRKRVGATGIEQLLKESLEAAKRHRTLTDKESPSVNLDTTSRRGVGLHQRTQETELAAGEAAGAISPNVPEVLAPFVRIRRDTVGLDAADIFGAPGLPFEVVRKVGGNI